MAISPDDLNRNFDSGMVNVNDWCVQTVKTNDIKNQAIAALTGLCSSDSLAGFIGFLSVLVDCMEQMGATLGLVGATISQVSYMNDYFNSLQYYFSEGNNISLTDSENFSTDMRSLYLRIGGEQAWATGTPDPSKCPVFLTTDQQSTIISYLNSLTKAYCDGSGKPDSWAPSEVWTDQTTAQTAQKNWWKSSTNPDGAPSNPDPSLSPSFNSAQMTLQQMSTYVTSLNSTLSTKQKYFSDQYEHCETSAEKMVDFFTNADGVKVQNQKTQ